MIRTRGWKRRTLVFTDVEVVFSCVGHEVECIIIGEGVVGRLVASVDRRTYLSGFAVAVGKHLAFVRFL